MQHQAHILQRGATSTFAQIIKPRNQHGLLVLGIIKHEQLKPVCIVHCFWVQVSGRLKHLDEIGLRRSNIETP